MRSRLKLWNNKRDFMLGFIFRQSYFNTDKMPPSLPWYIFFLLMLALKQSCAAKSAHGCIKKQENMLLDCASVISLKVALWTAEEFLRLSLFLAQNMSNENKSSFFMCGRKSAFGPEQVTIVLTLLPMIQTSNDHNMPVWAGYLCCMSVPFCRTAQKSTTVKLSHISNCYLTLDKTKR